MTKPSSQAHSSRTDHFSARFENLDKVRSFVAQAAEDCGLDEAASYAVQLAVDEAFTNIIEHAYGGETDQQIACTCSIGREGLKIILQDWGRSFNPEEVPDPNLDSSLEERTAGGLGLFFMRNMMDEVQFEFIPGSDDQKGSNVLVMIKRKEPNR